MMNISNFEYIFIIILGFVVPFVLTITISIKNKLIKLEYYLYCYFLFILFFLIFAKLLYCIANFQLNEKIQLLISPIISSKLSFVLSGYSFIGGYIGGLFGVIIFLKLIKHYQNEIILLFTLNLLLMYSILKIGCFLKGCCYSTYLPIPIQLIESFISFLSFTFILYLNKKKYTTSFLICLGLLLFALIRFITAFFRYFSTNFGFILNQVICIFLILLSMYLLYKKSKQTNFLH